MMRAQEDIACSSGLSRCLETRLGYYVANRDESALLCTNHTICSPHVPCFRGSDWEFLEEYFLASMITAPAPNAGQFLRRDSKGYSDVFATLWMRSGYILAAAQWRGIRHFY